MWAMNVEKQASPPYVLFDPNGNDWRTLRRSSRRRRVCDVRGVCDEWKATADGLRFVALALLLALLAAGLDGPSNASETEARLLRRLALGRGGGATGSELREQDVDRYGTDSKARGGGEPSSSVATFEWLRHECRVGQLEGLTGA